MIYSRKYKQSCDLTKRQSYYTHSTRPSIEYVTPYQRASAFDRISHNIGQELDYIGRKADRALDFTGEVIYQTGKVAGEVFDYAYDGVVEGGARELKSQLSVLRKGQIPVLNPAAIATKGYQELATRVARDTFNSVRPVSSQRVPQRITSHGTTYHKIDYKRPSYERKS